MSSFEIYDRKQYFAELIAAAHRAKAGERLTVMAMILDPEVVPVTGLIQAMTAAAQRGVRATVAVDAHNFMIVDSSKFGPLFTGADIRPEWLRPPFKQRYDILEAFRAAGGAYHIINRPVRAFSNPFGGRSHIKLALAGNRVFLGGCNFDHADYLDIMVAQDNATLADWLEDMLKKTIAAGSVRQALQGQDQTLDVSDTATLFVDAGIRHQSLILQQAHQLMDDAQEHITITCQYFPGGSTAQRLLAAYKRGVNVEVYYSHHSVHGKQAFGQWLYTQRERLRLPAPFFVNQLAKGVPKLHAKVLASESAVLVGSHNYVEPGVNFGTAETALLVRDADFSRSVVANIVGQITALRPG